MITHKLTKKQLKMVPYDLLLSLGVNDDKNANPDKVYMSKEDYNNLKLNIERVLLKEKRSLTKHLVELSVGMELLTYGPNTSLADGIRPGYVLIES